MIPPWAANVISPGLLNSCDPLAMVFGFTGPVSVIGCTMLTLESLDAGFTVFMDTGISSGNSSVAGRGTVTFNPSCVSLTCSPKALTMKVFTALDTTSC